MILGRGNWKISGALVFNLPQGYTCPGAGACRRYCYAKHGLFKTKQAMLAAWKNYESAKDPAFAENMLTALKHRRLKRLRIHASGDFFSLEYLQAWYRVARAREDMIFLAYTKSLPFIMEGGEPPSNFIILASLGGKYDNLAPELEAKGYIRGLTVVIPDISQAPRGWYVCPATIPGLKHRKACGRLCDYCWRPQGSKRVVFIQH
mgnify:CR=1 FL=1